MLKLKPNLFGGVFRSRPHVIRSITSAKSPHPNKGRMLEHQKELPKLPVAPLNISMEKYLLSLQPLLNEKELATSKSVVEEFIKPTGLGPTLHTKLTEHAAKMDNWLSDWWLQQAYLEYRSPLLVYSSPGLVFPKQNFTSKEDQLRYTVNLIVAVLSFKKEIDNHDLEPDRMGQQFLDMSQYENIFSTCRIPGKPSDALCHYQKMGTVVRHIVVVSNNHYYEMEVIDQNGRIIQPAEILTQLQQVAQDSGKRAEPIGVLTSQDRDSWHKAYQNLTSNRMNSESASQIQKSIFIVCLDQADPIGSNEPLTRCGVQAIHGNRINSGNRWNDKTLQFLVSEDGLVGMTYEHSPAEGPPIARLMDFVNRFGSMEKLQMDDPVNSLKPKELLFDVSEQSKADIEQAKQSLDQLIKNLDLQCYKFPIYGQNFIKSQKHSPDSYIQMAIQLAYYRLHNRSAPTYESASLRKFIYGRTETIRSASSQSEAFCRGMLDNSISPRDKANRLKEAISAHKMYVTDAINGLGIDRLLLGLKRISISEAMPLPEIFKDKGFHESTHFRLSTSQVSASSDSVMCFGAVVEDGYGCCYNPRPDSINFGLSSYNSCPQTDTNKFREALSASLEQMQNVLLMAQPSKL